MPSWQTCSLIPGISEIDKCVSSLTLKSSNNFRLACGSCHFLKRFHWLIQILTPSINDIFNQIYDISRICGPFHTLGTYIYQSNAQYTLPVFTGREHGCHFAHQWKQASFLDAREDGPSRSAGAIVNDVINIVYLQNRCPKWNPCWRPVYGPWTRVVCIDWAGFNVPLNTL